MKSDLYGLAILLAVILVFWSSLGSCSRRLRLTFLWLALLLVLCLWALPGMLCAC